MESGEFKRLKMQVIRRLMGCLNQAEAYFKQTFPIPTVHYNVRGQKAGVAYLQQNEIRLNPILLQENPEYFLKQVIPHELAHLLAFRLFGRVKPHGQEWRGIMQGVFHLNGEITHRLNTESVRGKTFPYLCGCQTHWLTTRRHQQILQGKCYICRQCKALLVKM